MKKTKLEKKASPKRRPPKRHSKMAPLAVRRHNPKRHFIIVTAVTIGVVLAFVVIYFVGLYHGGYNYIQATSNRARLLSQRNKLQKVNNDLQRQLVKLSHTSKIDREALKKVQQANSALQGQVVKLRKKLSFYTDIVAPGKVALGVKVQALNITADNGHYRYNLVLLQGPRHRYQIRGSVRVAVIGTNGKTGFDVTRDFKFRYFQNLDGKLKLPDGFKPARVEVIVSPVTRGVPRAKRSFSWQVTH